MWFNQPRIAPRRQPGCDLADLATASSHHGVPHLVSLHTHIIRLLPCAGMQKGKADKQSASSSSLASTSNQHTKRSSRVSARSLAGKSLISSNTKRFYTSTTKYEATRFTMAGSKWSRLPFCSAGAAIKANHLQARVNSYLPTLAPSGSSRA